MGGPLALVLGWPYGPGAMPQADMIAGRWPCLCANRMTFSGKAMKKSKKPAPDASLVRQIRKNVIDLLETYSCEAEQREYQKNVPWISVPTELVEMWFTDTFHPGDESFGLAFGPAEIEAISRFHAAFDQIVHGRQKIDISSTSLDELLNNERWRKVMNEAAIALEALKTSGP
jgi:hypothetical protein